MLWVLLAYLLACAYVSYIWSYHRFGFWGWFMFSMLFSPIITGILYFLIAQRKEYRSGNVQRRRR